MSQEVRARFAPSPTGPFHIGNARTALFNFLFAKKNDGKLILRIEDTDKERSKEEYELDIEHSLSWMGISWDEGPETENLFGPYHQSKRQEIYKKYINKLLDDKLAYYCYCTPEELDNERKKLEAEKKPPKYSGHCLNLTEKEIAQYKKEGRKPAIRFRVDPSVTGGKIKFIDLIHGDIEFDPNLIGDFIIVKPTGEPIFLLTNIIDDAEMKISHVIRGEDHLSNTPKQLMIANALCLPFPEYAHLPMILSADRTKLSKRRNATSITHDYRDQGYLPEAMVNFLALLGWSPTKTEKEIDGQVKEREFFSPDDLINEFSLENVNKSPAIFDQSKLDYLNGYYIRKLSLGELAKRCMPFLHKAGLIHKEDEKLLNAIGLVQERMKKLSEAPELTSFFFKKPEYEAELLIGKKSDKEITLKALKESVIVLEKEDDYSRDSIEQLLRALAQKINIQPGHLLWPIRVSLSGKSASPGAFELIEYFKKDETLARIKTAIDMLQ